MTSKVTNLEEKLQALTPEQYDRYTVILDGLNRVFPAGLSPRHKMRSTGLISPGTLANEDSRKEGPEGRIIVRGKTFYINEGLALHLCRK